MNATLPSVAAWGPTCRPRSGVLRRVGLYAGLPGYGELEDPHRAVHVHARRAVNADDWQAVRALFEQCSRVMLGLTCLPQPVIARVHGIATAAGCQLVAACDLAVCSDDSRFATSGVKYGLFCSTPMVALSRNVPRKAALEMLLTGDAIDAAAAARFGLVNKVVPAARLMDEALAIARRIAANAPLAVQAAKELALRSNEGGLAAGLRFEQFVQQILRHTEDAIEGRTAFAEKREPRFQGR